MPSITGGPHCGIGRETTTWPAGTAQARRARTTIAKTTAQRLFTGGTASAYGLQSWQGLYPLATASSLEEKNTLLDSFICLTDEHVALWNILLALFPT